MFSCNIFLSSKSLALATVDSDGLTPSVLAGSGSIDELMRTFESSSHGFMLETDYMDDPKRPGAVLGPKTVPKRTRQLLKAGLDEEILYNCHRDLPDRIYGVQ